MKLQFYKYHGTGNDFIIIEDADASIEKQLNADIIKQWCHRRFGVGADGLMLLQRSEEALFFMRYYNSDGHLSSMCGNGGRCISQFAYDMGWTKETSFEFMAVDGRHHVSILDNSVSLGMNPVEEIILDGKALVMDTGSPHYVQWVSNIEQVDIVQQGKAIRYNDRYKAEGINVNCAQIKFHNQLAMLTYERGVEDETYACGTGTVAVAVAYAKQNLPDGSHKITIDAKGGQLAVELIKSNNRYYAIQLIGNAVQVFQGELTIS